MKASRVKIERRLRRKRGIRKRVCGTSEKPRLTVFRSLKHMYAQLIDDENGVTICSASTRARDLRDKITKPRSTEGAKLVGAAIAEKAKEKNVTQVCFDRNGYRFHGRLKALADAAREGGLKF